MDFLMNSVRSPAPESASNFSNLVFSSAFRRKLYLRSAGSLLGFLPVLVPVVLSMHMRFLVCTFFSSGIRDFGADSPAPGRGGQVGSCRTKDFLSDKDTTCSVRLNRESSFVGLLRDVHGVLWSGEVSSFPLSDSGFAKLDSDNRLVNSA